MKRKFLVWLALFALLLAGCNGNLPDITTTPTTTVPTTTAAPLVSDIYADAVDALAENVTAIVSVENQLTVANSQFTNSAEMSVTYVGLGSDALSARVKKTLTYGEYSTEIYEYYQAGKAYASILENNFSQDMSQEDFLARYLPVALLDASLYETVTMEGDTITFADATALEAWLEGELISASGTATLKNGTLSETTYTATYTVEVIDKQAPTSVKISGGSLTLQAGSDGVRSNNAEEAGKGYITMENTTLNITAGNDGIQAENLLRLTEVSLTVQSGGGSGNAPDEINSYKGIKAGSDVLVTGGSIQIDARDDAIHSDGTVSLSGGSHTLSSGGDGIQAETDLSVSDSEVTVKAAAKGMNANQLVVQKGSLHITAAGNGLDAKGDLTLSQTRALIFGATKADSTSLDFGRSVRITGGFVLGLSDSGADPALSSAGQGIVCSSVGDQGEGTAVSVTDEAGNLLCSEKAPSAYNVVIFSGEGLQAGQSATLTAGSFTASVDIR